MSIVLWCAANLLLACAPQTAKDSVGAAVRTPVDDGHETLIPPGDVPGAAIEALRLERNDLLAVAAEFGGCGLPVAAEAAVARALASDPSGDAWLPSASESIWLARILASSGAISSARRHVPTRLISSSDAWELVKLFEEYPGVVSPAELLAASASVEPPGDRVEVVIRLAASVEPASARPSVAELRELRAIILTSYPAKGQVALLAQLAVELERRGEHAAASQALAEASSVVDMVAAPDLLGVEIHRARAASVVEGEGAGAAILAAAGRAMIADNEVALFDAPDLVRALWAAGERDVARDVARFIARKASPTFMAMFESTSLTGVAGLLVAVDDKPEAQRVVAAAARLLEVDGSRPRVRDSLDEAAIAQLAQARLALGDVDGAIEAGRAATPSANRDEFDLSILRRTWGSTGGSQGAAERLRRVGSSRAGDVAWMEAIVREGDTGGLVRALALVHECPSPFVRARALVDLVPKADAALGVELVKQALSEASTAENPRARGALLGVAACGVSKAGLSSDPALIAAFQAAR